MSENNYNDNIFINCPFDEQYRGLFRAITFTILDCGFIPRCSLEIADATQFRLGAILDIVRMCRYGIHDLSRVELDQATNLPRFNMPFELGIFFGAKHIGSGKHQGKQCMVLEKAKYRYQKYISDISGTDVTAHQNSAKSAVHAVRNWLVTASHRKNIPQGEEINRRYKQFQREIRTLCRQRNIRYDFMPFIEMTTIMSDWLRLNQVTSGPLFQRG